MTLNDLEEFATCFAPTLIGAGLTWVFVALMARWSEGARRARLAREVCMGLWSVVIAMNAAVLVRAVGLWYPSPGAMILLLFVAPAFLLLQSVVVLVFVHLLSESALRKWSDLPSGRTRSIPIAGFVLGLALGSVASISEPPSTVSDESPTSPSILTETKASHRVALPEVRFFSVGQNTSVRFAERRAISLTK